MTLAGLDNFAILACKTNSLEYTNHYSMILIMVSGHDWLRGNICYSVYWNRLSFTTQTHKAVQKGQFHSELPFSTQQKIGQDISQRKPFSIFHHDDKKSSQYDFVSYRPSRST